MRGKYLFRRSQKGIFLIRTIAELSESQKRVKKQLDKKSSQNFKKGFATVGKKLQNQAYKSNSL
jgi:hypothetical protein